MGFDTIEINLVFNMKEGSLLIKKIKSKIADEPSFSFKLAEKVGKLVLLWQK